MFHFQNKTYKTSAAIADLIAFQASKKRWGDFMRLADALCPRSADASGCTDGLHHLPAATMLGAMTELWKNGRLTSFEPTLLRLEKASANRPDLRGLHAVLKQRNLRTMVA